MQNFTYKPYIHIISKPINPNLETMTNFTPILAIITFPDG